MVSKCGLRQGCVYNDPSPSQTQCLKLRYLTQKQTPIRLLREHPSIHPSIRPFMHLSIHTLTPPSDLHLVSILMRPHHHSAFPTSLVRRGASLLVSLPYCSISVENTSKRLHHRTSSSGDFHLFPCTRNDKENRKPKIHQPFN